MCRTQERSPHKFSTKANDSGFTLVETMMAIAILTIGLLGVAAMITSTASFGTRARYMNMANVLASEKLDSLNKYPATDLNMAAGGALTGPAVCGATDIYCDQVTVNEVGGADYETQTQVVNGTDVTTTVVHTKTGCVDTPANCGVTAPAAGAGSTFTRRWLITANPTVTAVGGGTVVITGARKITVIVTLNNQVASVAAVSFQMSMVRP
jgi:prepilin-type N-terminal cleavage/methylation domain-containing protein